MKLSVAVVLVLASISESNAAGLDLAVSPRCRDVFTEYEATVADQFKSFAIRLDGSDCAFSYDYGDAAATENAAMAFCRRTGGDCRILELIDGEAKNRFEGAELKALLGSLRGVTNTTQPKQEAEKVFGSWRLSTSKSDNGLRCTVRSNPAVTGEVARLASPDFRVTNEEDDPFALSVNMQMPLDADTLHYAVVDGSVYPLFNPNNPIVLTTYARGQSGEVEEGATKLGNRAIARALFFGSELIVRATSREGALVEDVYPLDGLPEALSAANWLCGGS